jgi:hypothetical protein
MLGGLHIYGGFNISPYLAMRVFEAVDEINAKNLNRELSHLDDGECELCKGDAAKELRDDAAQPDQPGRQWTA